MIDPYPGDPPSDDVLAMADEMRRLAINATEGVWRHNNDYRIAVIDDYGRTVATCRGATTDDAVDNAAYIAAVHPQAVLAVIDALAAAREALRPFAEEFERQRERYLKRGDRKIMEGNFNRMPDHWPAQLCNITMGHCRAARAHLPQARADEEGLDG